MLSRKLMTKLTKAMYMFGIVFLLTGMLLSAVNVPVMAQEEEPPTDYCCPPDPVYPVVTIESAGCEQIIFKVSGTKNPSQGFTLYAAVTDGATYVASVTPSSKGVDYYTEDTDGDGKGEWVEYITVTLTEAWTTAPAGSASFTLQATAWGYSQEDEAWIIIGQDSGSAYNDECGYVPQADLAVGVTLNSIDCEDAVFDVTVTNSGDADAENVTLEYLTDGAASGTPSATDVGTVAAGTASGPYEITVPVAWLTESDYVELTAIGLVDGAEFGRDSASADYPGGCIEPDVYVSVVTQSEGCEEAVFEVTVTNDSEGTANLVNVNLAATGANVAGDPNPLSINVGTLAPGASSTPVLVTVPVDWANSNDFGLFITLNATVTVEGEFADDGSDDAYNQEECYIPGPEVTLDAEDMEHCGLYPEEVCVDFTLNIANLPEGSIVTVGEMEFTENGTFPVTICGDWPGIGHGLDPVEIDLYAEAYLDGEFMDDATSVVYYDPETSECQLPDGGLLIQDPFCYATHDGYKAAWQVINTSGFPIDFTWSLNGGELNVATAPANDLVWIGNFNLDQTNTVSITYAGNVDEHAASISSVTCKAPTPPPPPTPPNSDPVPVTAVEQPAPVAEAGVLIPVTGVDLAGAIDLGFFKSLMIYMGLGFLGLAFVTHSLRNRFK